MLNNFSNLQLIFFQDVMSMPKFPMETSPVLITYPTSLANTVLDTETSVNSLVNPDTFQCFKKNLYVRMVE